MKRLKCDETKPYCFQCRRRKISCPGYHTKIRWAADNQHLGGRPSASTDIKDAPDTDIPANFRNVTSDLVETHHVSPPSAIAAQVTPESFAGSPGEMGPSPTSHPAGNTAADATAADSSPATYISASENCPSRRGTLVSAALHENRSPCDAESYTQCSFLPQSPRDNDPSYLSPFANETSETHWSHHGSITSNLSAEDKSLLQHYFTKVCALNSAFDSPANPFRYMIAELVVDSPLILNSVLGLSAWWEVQQNPQFLARAVHYHSVAVGYLSDILSNIQRRDTSLLHGQAFPPSSHEYDQIKQAILASILLGFSSVSPD